MAPLFLGALSCVAMLPGCISAEKRKQMADADSILGGVFKPTTPAEAAAWAADPHDADKRARGMQLLANAPFGGAEPYLALYRERIDDEYAPVRSVAARALALHGGPDDVPRITPLLSKEEPLTRLEATRALQRLHNPVAVAPLIDRLNLDKEAEPEIRAEAASALGQYAEGRVLQALIAALADPSLLVNANAQASLKTLTGQDDLPAERKPWVDWVKANERPFASRRPYVYPVFWREKRWLDYVPFMPPVPNEQASTPAGFTLDEPVKKAG
jgi:hypothetical protein